ncbi:MAG: hypothetical protein DI596_14255, partial [Azospira oryzae]
GVIITDANGVVEYANPAFCDMTGYSLEEVLGPIAPFQHAQRQGEQPGRRQPVQPFQRLLVPQGAAGEQFSQSVGFRRSGDNLAMSAHSSFQSRGPTALGDRCRSIAGFAGRPPAA